MRLPTRTSWRPAETRYRAPPADGNWPTPGEVLGETGLLLAGHLAAALAVVLVLRWCGIG